MDRSENKSSGRICVFLSRGCGTLTAIICLLCGFVTLIPLPSQIIGSITRCIPTGLLLIVSAVIMFFLEASVLGYCFEKMAFLVKLSKYANHWIRFVLYLIFAIIPVLTWCLSASTLVCLGLFFTVAALNFVLAIGTKGEHTTYEKVTLSDLQNLEVGVTSDNEESETSSLPTHKDSSK